MHWLFFAVCGMLRVRRKRFFETARCSDSVYVVGEGGMKGGGLTDKWEANAVRSIPS